MTFLSNMAQYGLQDKLTFIDFYSEHYTDWIFRTMLTFKCFSVMQSSFLSLVLICLVINAQAQNTSNPSFTLPNVPSPEISNPQYNLLGSPQEINQVNLRIIDQDARNHESGLKKQEETLKNAYKELGIDESESRSSSLKISYSLPTNKAYGKMHFENAFKEINNMVEEKKPYNLKRAVFLTEHAYDTALNYSQFEQQISKLVEIIQIEMKQKKISADDNLGKIMAAFKFMADTLKVKHPVTERSITTYPKTYDFEDFYGMQDYHKMFVSKLIKSGKGQCHSLPLLFLILCAEIKATAFLAYAPEHSYVKVQDKNGSFHNMELTNQMFTSDQFILQSGFINSAAIKNHIYMDTVGINRVVLHTLNDLANSYVKKYRYDDFVFKCAKLVISIDPNNVHANMHLANYFNSLGHNVERQLNLSGKTFNAAIGSDDQFRVIISNAVKYGKLLDDLGYAEMPPDMYAAWLNSLKNESMKQQHLERKRILSNMVER